MKVLNPPPAVPIVQNKSVAQVSNNNEAGENAHGKSIEEPLIVEPKTMFGDSLLLAQINNTN